MSIIGLTRNSARRRTIATSHEDNNDADSQGLRHSVMLSELGSTQYDGWGAGRDIDNLPPFNTPF